MHPTSKRLSAGLQTAVRVTAIIDLIIGLMFLFAPEVGFTLWPTPIAPVLSRFIGSIIVANGVGAWLVVRQGTWEGARVLFAVALVYGVVVLVALLYHLLVVWVDAGIRPEEVWAELRRREGVSGIAEKAARPKGIIRAAKTTKLP